MVGFGIRVGGFEPKNLYSILKVVTIMKRGMKMREGLKSLNGEKLTYSASVEKRRPGLRLGGKEAWQRLFKDIISSDGSVTIDHMVMTVGREIPAIPLVYSRIVPGCVIEFEAVPVEYTRHSDGSKDFCLRLTKLISSNMRR